MPRAQEPPEYVQCMDEEEARDRREQAYDIFCLVRTHALLCCGRRVRCECVHVACHTQMVDLRQDKGCGCVLL